MESFWQKCASCENLLKEGDLYCSQCGTCNDESPEDVILLKNRERRQRIFRILSMLLFMAMAAGVGFVVGGLDLLGISAHEKTQLEKARIYAAEGKYMKAEQSYKGLINQDPKNEELYKELFTFYLMNNRKDKANNTIKWSNSNGVNVLDGMRPPPPTCSLPSGKYKGEKIVSCTAYIKENIYYTTDGSAPTFRSSIYSNPIKLMEGKVTLTLVAESPLGILSIPAEYSYTITPSGRRQ